MCDSGVRVSSWFHPAHNPSGKVEQPDSLVQVDEQVNITGHDVLT